MMDANTLRAFFESEYPGKTAIFENLIKPIFGNAKDASLTEKQELLDSDKRQIKSMSIIAQARGAFPIIFADVELQDSVVLKRSRVQIQSCVRRIMADDTNALIFFHFADTQKEWRVSYVHRAGKPNESTSAKRYTYLCGTEHQCRTVAERFAKLSEYTRIDDEKLLEAFSVEALTEDFYKELFDWYEWTVETAKYPAGSGSKVTLVSENESKGENIIRLITRLMFVWFIKQKKLVPDWIFEPKRISEYLADFDENSLTNGEYYNAILQNLFFATLNKDLKERAWAKGNGEDRSEDYGVKTLYRDNLKKSFFKENKADDLLNAFKEVPFLNGGLFECLDNTHTRPDGTNEQTYVDGFSREASRRAFVPNALFFQNSNGKTGTHEGLLNILKCYNFTIEENSPIDVEIALDPELLGKVFENLLGVFNPETSDTARHETGSFYTPREIVNYMVDQSLKEYLKTNVAGLDDDLLDSIFESGRDISLSLNMTGHSERSEESVKNDIKSALKKVKVLDPACGSGAFPMGMLNRIVDIYKQLSHDDELTQKAIYSLKKEIIENCIYGVDIQPIAVQISKLRFFISLICEQEKDASEDNFGYYPLPNLETKFVAANTLVQLEKSEPTLFVNPEIDKTKVELHRIRSEHFKANTAEKKHTLRLLDKENREKLAKLLEDDKICDDKAAKQLSEWNPYDQNSSSPFFDSEWMFEIGDGFDIVIGNPPYIRRTSINENDKKYYEKNYASAVKQYDMYLLFIEKGMKILNHCGNLIYINPIRFFNADYGYGCRKLLAENYTIKSVLDISQLPVFQSAMTYPCILHVLNKKDNKIVYQKLSSLAEIDNVKNIKSISTYQSEILADPYFKFIIDVENDVRNLIKKINAKGEQVSKLFDIARGLANSKVDFDGSKYKALKSTNVRKYFIEGELKNIDTQFADIFKQEMIILPRTVEYVQAMLKEKDIVCLDRIYYLIPKHTMNLKFALGVINSKLTNFWFEFYYKTTKVSGNYFDLNGKQIGSILIPEASQAQQNQIADLVDKILAAKKADHNADTSKLEKEIDELVYNLYGLTEEEIKVVEGK